VGKHKDPSASVRDTIIPTVISTAIGTFAFTVDLAVATVADAAQMGISGYALPVSSHLISAEYTGVGSGMKWAGGHVNNPIANFGVTSFDAIKISAWIREQGLKQDGEYEHGARRKMRRMGRRRIRIGRMCQRMGRMWQYRT
jgi:hypothetical protein